MKVAWNPLYCHHLPANHRFPMEKYELLPQQLLHEGTINSEHLFSPGHLTETQILAVHDVTYWSKLKNLQLRPDEIRRSGFPLSKALIIREALIARGTIEAAHFAMDYGVSFNIAGGTHHAGTDFAEGFCLLNDLAIAAQYLVLENLANRVLIIDLDVHHGNGTAEIFRGNLQVVTFSMHGAKNFPLNKPPSDLDVPLEDGTGDGEYLRLLQEHLTGFCKQVKPDFVFYQAGVDVLRSDTLGRLALTLQGCKLRDQLVMQYCRKEGIPLTVVMGGGYSPDINTILEAHANTYRTAKELYF